jgi:hypothetical protein
MGWEMPKLNVTHHQLAMLAGTWAGQETMFPSPWNAEPSEATARTTYRVALDGFAVVGDYEQSRGGQVTFRGHAVWTVDPGNGQVILTWFDSLGTLPETFRGGLDGQTLQVTSQTSHGLNRLTYTLIDGHTMASRMELSQDGTDWKPMFEGRYTRERVGG